MCGSAGSLLENVALKETPLLNILSAEANLRLFHCCCFCCWCLFKINANKELQVTELRRTGNHAKSSYSRHYSAAHPQKCSQFTLYFNFYNYNVINKVDEEVRRSERRSRGAAADSAEEGGLRNERDDFQLVREAPRSEETNETWRLLDT